MRNGRPGWLATAARLHLRRSLRVLPTVAATWIAVVVAASRLSGLRTGPFEVIDLAVATVAGVMIGGAMSFFETRPVRRGLLNVRPYLDLVLRSLLYGVAIVSFVAFVQYVLAAFLPIDSVHGVEPSVGNIVSDPRAARFVLLLFAATFVVNFLLHLQLIVGSAHLRAIFAGSYRLPVEEERVFVFVDLIGSTATALRLGDLAFTHLKHDIFCDFAEPIREAGGQIVQYVGDEVMLTWPVGRLSAKHDPVACLAAMRRRLRERGAHYESSYGAVPDFRVGAHAGRVVVAEIGDTYRDIVYSGDTVNTAARLLQACRPLGVGVLLSSGLLELLAQRCGTDVPTIALEPLVLRGRERPLAVVTIVSPSGVYP